MRNPDELDLASEAGDWNAYETHDVTCSCDACSGAYDHEDAIEAPSQAELDRRFAYFMSHKRGA